MADSGANLGYQAATKSFMAPKDVAAWFLRDMAEVSGYAAAADWVEGRKLSAHATYRPILTAPDPWYFAAIVALEFSKTCDVFPRDQADQASRGVFAGMDAAIGLSDDSASSVTLMIMGRLGMGSLLMHRKVPDNLLAKAMLILLGSPTAAAPHMPDENAYDQIRAALKLEPPVWWMMFQRRFELQDDTPPPRLVPSVLAAPARTVGDTA